MGAYRIPETAAHLSLSRGGAAPRMKSAEFPFQHGWPESFSDVGNPGGSCLWKLRHQSQRLSRHQGHPGKYSIWIMAPAAGRHRHRDLRTNRSLTPWLKVVHELSRQCPRSITNKGFGYSAAGKACSNTPKSSFFPATRPVLFSRSGRSQGGRITRLSDFFKAARVGPVAPDIPRLSGHSSGEGGAQRLACSASISLSCSAGQPHR